LVYLSILRALALAPNEQPDDPLGLFRIIQSGSDLHCGAIHYSWNGIFLPLFSISKTRCADLLNVNLFVYFDMYAVW